MNESRNKNQPRIRKIPLESEDKGSAESSSKKGNSRGEFLRDVGSRLRKIRLEKGWTQDKMAECLGITKTFYGKIERGESSIALDKLALLNEKMDIDLNYLITGEKAPMLSVDFQEIPREKRYSMEQLIKNAINLASPRNE